jgi:hypothetical protein
MIKRILLLLVILSFFGCEPPEDGNDGITKEYAPDTGIAETKYALNGKAENAACRKPGSILVYPLDENLYQTGNPVYGYINDDSGAFGARGFATGTHAFYVAENLTCRNEISADYDTGIKFFSLTDLTENERNLSPLTTIEYLVAIEYFDSSGDVCYQDADCSTLKAHDNILSYLGMPSTNIRFSEMTLQGDRQADAILGIVNSMIANGRTGIEQNSYMLDIANAVLNGDQVFKADIEVQINSLPIKTIKTNLENIYSGLGLGALCPPIWDLPFLPVYYSDLLTRTPDILESFSFDYTSPCGFDTSGFNSFAYPTVFNRIEEAVYFASELTGDISIWSAGICIQSGNNYPCPLTKLVTIEELNETLLEPVVAFNGYFGSHGLINGQQYFTVQNFETNQRPVHACDADLLPFGRVLAAVDNDWGAAIGWNNSTTWYNRAPLIFTTN